VRFICGSFQLGAPCRIHLRIFPTWSSMSDSSADLFNLELHVGFICGSFQLGAPCPIYLQIFPTWSPMSDSSADLFNLEPHVRFICRSFQLGAPCPIHLADLFNLEPHVRFICRSFQLGAPCPIHLRIFSTWNSMSDLSADLSNLELPCRKLSQELKSSATLALNAAVNFFRCPMSSP
jgi:hypothetical protein